MSAHCSKMMRPHKIQCGPVGTGGAEGVMAPPDFGRSVNPISTRGAYYASLYPPHYLPHRILCPSYGPEFIAAFFSTRRSYFILGSRQYAGSVLTLRRFEYDYGGQKAICQFCRCAGSISDQAELKTRDSYF